MFICENDEEAKKKVTGILKDLGWGAFKKVEEMRLPPQQIACFRKLGDLRHRSD